MDSEQIRRVNRINAESHQTALEMIRRANRVNSEITAHSENRPNEVASEQDSEGRRRQREEGSPLFVLPHQSSSGGPARGSENDSTPGRDRNADRTFSRLVGMTARRGRPRLGPSDRYLDRNRALNAMSTLSGEIATAESGLADLQHAGRQLEAASSTLRSLLDDPIPNLSSPSHEGREYSNEAEHNRRVKRRKLDTDKTDSEFSGFIYGKYGQVEPGKLKMEIVSCDGGIYQETGGDYSADNVLKNDGTVYCTKSNRCNLVLRHQGATTFSLKELIIKAPHSGYTAP